MLSSGTKNHVKRFIIDFEGEPLEADMLLMCLPFVIYTATMQMFFDNLSPAPTRVRDTRDDR